MAESHLYIQIYEFKLKTNKRNKKEKNARVMKN